MNPIVIINGPNLNLLGQREIHLYGDQKFDVFFSKLKEVYATLHLEYFQSNIEGELVNAIQNYTQKGFYIVMNPAGYSHTSVAIADAILASNATVVEVHITNLYTREAYRHLSLTGSKSVGVISGLGLKGYELAVDFLKNYKS